MSTTSEYAGVTTPRTGDQAPLISRADLAQWLSLGPVELLDATVAANIDAAIRITSAAVRARVGCPIVLVTDDTVTLDGNGGQAFLLPSYPVQQITSIREEGALLDPSAYDYSMLIGRVRRTDGACWTRALSGLQIRYSHGYDPIPDEIIGACLTKAARVLGSPDGRTIRAETIGTYSVSYNTAFGAGARGATGTGWTETEHQTLSRYADGR